MTTPEERTKAVIGTRDFLRILATGAEITIPGLVQSVATCLLRHYPSNVDLAVSASAMPGIWGAPWTVRPGEKQQSSAEVLPLNKSRCDEPPSR
jgi:hypothetical protein